MPADNATSTVTPAVTTDSQANLRVDCYVRSTIPAAVTETITGVVDRLCHLCETERIAAYRVTRWPPACHAVADPADERAPPRDELVNEFERWAAQHGHSLEPAFRRQERQPSTELGVDGRRKRVRVPLVALALYETAADSDTTAETLRGVVPYTERPHTDDERTYTVDEWLSAVEAEERGPYPLDSRAEQPSPAEGHQ